MASEHGERELVAILAADIAGCSRLAGAEEERTLVRLRTLRGDLIDPAIAIHRGRIVKRTDWEPDGVFDGFISAAPIWMSGNHMMAALLLMLKTWSVSLHAFIAK